MRELKECPICKEKYWNLGSHLGACMLKNGGMNNQAQQQEVKPLSTLEQLQEKRKKRLLEQNEMLMIEAENRRLRDEINGVDREVKTDSFNQAIDLMSKMDELTNKKIKEREELLSLTGDDLAETPEDKIFLKMIEGVMNQKPANKEILQETPIKKEIPKEIKGFITAEELQEVKEAVKSGKLTKEDARAYSKDFLTDEQFNKYWVELNE